MGQKCQYLTKNANIWPKMPILGHMWLFFGQKSVFLGETQKLRYLGPKVNFLSKWDISPVYPWLQLSHSDHPEINFWGSPQFLAILGESPIAIISTLNFGPWSTKHGIVRLIKRMTHNDQGPGTCQNYGEMAVFTNCPKVFFLAKNPLFSKKNEIR